MDIRLAMHDFYLKSVNLDPPAANEQRRVGVMLIPVTPERHESACGGGEWVMLYPTNC
jgi:hypothetical protein